jgi:hypothetical protein
MRVYLKGNQPDPTAAIDLPPALASGHTPGADADFAPTGSPAPLEPDWQAVEEPAASLAPFPTAEARAVAPAPRHIVPAPHSAVSEAADETTDPEPELTPEPTATEPATESIEQSELAGEIARIFIDDGDLPGAAMSKACRLIASHGVELCEQQLAYFPARVARAQASPNGLRNASGLFIKSVTQDWAPPVARKPAPKVKTWYTPEEYEYLIIH